MRPSDPRQPDLFDLPAHVPASNVVAFPVARRACLVRRLTSELLAIPTKPDRDRHWRKRMRPIRSHLLALGLPADQVSRQMMDLRTAVGCEARRRVHLAMIRGEVAS